MQVKLVVIGVVLLLVPGFAGCGTPAILTPPTGPGTDYPCGYTGVSCFPVDNTHTCCPEYHACIPDNLCEYQGHDHPSTDDLGAASPTKVTRFAEH